jgi:hypothetical protein
MLDDHGFLKMETIIARRRPRCHAVAVLAYGAASRARRLQVMMAMLKKAWGFPVRSLIAQPAAARGEESPIALIQISAISHAPTCAAHRGRPTIHYKVKGFTFFLST